MKKEEKDQVGIKVGRKKEGKNRRRKRHKEKSSESHCRSYAPAPGPTHPAQACQLKSWLKPTKCLQMKKELLEVLTAEACQLHCQRKVVREEQEGIAMTRKAGGTD